MFKNQDHGVNDRQTDRHTHMSHGWILAKYPSYGELMEKVGNLQAKKIKGVMYLSDIKILCCQDIHRGAILIRWGAILIRRGAILIRRGARCSSMLWTL